MMRAVMEGAGLTFWPVLSLVVFTLFILGLVAWLYRQGSGEFYHDMARLALGRAGAEAASREGREHGPQG